MPEKVVLILCIVLFIILMALTPPFLQLKITDTVNCGAFKYIKIKRMAFLFRAPNWDSVKKYGIPIPLFVIQVAGYVIALLSIIMNVILGILLKDIVKLMAIITASILGVELITIIVFVFILGKISKRGKNEK